jgi:hypothetical protein
MNTRAKIGFFVSYLLALSGHNERIDATEYCKVSDLDLQNRAVSLTITMQTLRDIEMKLQVLNLNYTLVQLTPFYDEYDYQTRDVKIIDIGL